MDLELLIGKHHAYGFDFNTLKFIAIYLNVRKGVLLLVLLV